MSRLPASIPALKKLARREADYLTKGLLIAPDRSPSAPCFVTLPIHFVRLEVFIDELATKRSISSTSLLRSDYAPLLNAAVTFANSIWTPEQRKTFESCRCREHETTLMESFHHGAYKNARGYYDGYGPLHETTRQVFTMISDVVSGIRLNPTDVIRLEKKSKNHGKWPSSPSIIMPYGPATTVSAFVTWASLIEEAAPFQTLSVLSLICPSLEQEMKQNKDWLPLLASIFSRFVVSVQKINLEELTSLRKEAVQRDVCNFIEIFGAAWFRFRVSVGADLDDIPSLKSIYSTACDFLPLIDRIPLSSPSTQRVQQEFGSLAFAIHSAVIMITFDEEALPSNQSLAPYAHYHDQDHVRAIRLYVNLLALRSLPRCAEMTCTQSSESTKTNLKKCARCQVVRYCSKACQTADWKVHKGVCDRLRVLMPIAFTWEQAGSSEGAEELMRRYLHELEEVGLTNEDIPDVNQYVLSHNRPWLKESELFKQFGSGLGVQLYL